MTPLQEVYDTRMFKLCGCDDEFATQSSSVTLQYYQWKSTDSRIEKVIMADIVDAIFNELKKQLSTFLLHTFVKKSKLLHLTS